MRQFYNDNGYVWIKNVIPREAVWDMREQYATHHKPISHRNLGMLILPSFLAQLKSTGILRPGTSPRDGIFNPVNDPLAHQGIGGTPEAQVLSMLDEVHQTPTYRAFTAHPAFRSFIRKFMGWKNGRIKSCSSAQCSDTIVHAV